MTEIIITEITDNNRSELFKIAFSMYLGEICPYCKIEFKTLEDLNSAVYNGYTEYGRIAHDKCFANANKRIGNKE